MLGKVIKFHGKPSIRSKVITKSILGEGTSSLWAQGGIAAAVDPDDNPNLHAELVLEDIKYKNFNLERFVYMRYFGQGHEIKVKIDNRKFDLKDTNYLKRNFEIEYEKLSPTSRLCKTFTKN